MFYVKISQEIMIKLLFLFTTLGGQKNPAPVVSKPDFFFSLNPFMPELLFPGLQLSFLQL